MSEIVFFSILTYVSYILYSLLSRPTNAKYIYVYINHILYTLLHFSMHPRHLQGVVSFYFAKVMKSLILQTQ